MAEEVLIDIRKYDEAQSFQLKEKIRLGLHTLTYGQLVKVFLNVRKGNFREDILREIYNQFGSRGGYPAFVSYLSANQVPEELGKAAVAAYKYFEEFLKQGR